MAALMHTVLATYGGYTLETLDAADAMVLGLADAAR